MDTPDYTLEVVLAYALSLLLLAGLVGMSVLQARRARRRLAEMEAARDG